MSILIWMFGLGLFAAVTFIIVMPRRPRTRRHRSQGTTDNNHATGSYDTTGNTDRRSDGDSSGDSGGDGGGGGGD